jgi:sugar porter (SP) family MFS transporter
MVPSLILAIGILFCPFSPRWLISNDREDEARDVLMKIRSASHDEIEDEMNRIRTEVADLRQSEVETYQQLFHAPLLRPLLLGIGIQILQQLTGINATIYYAPKIFEIFKHNSSHPANGVGSILDSPLSTTGIYGIVNFVFTIPAIILIDRLGRKILLIIGAVVMSISMFTASILVAVYIGRHCNNTLDSCTHIIRNQHTYSPVAIMFFIYMFVAGFAFSWGPVPWIYCTEIFPLTMRAKATSLTTAANWATNCLISFLVPILLYRMYYGIFIMFASFCAIMIGIVYSLYPETKNRHLEDNTTNENRRQNYNTFQERPIVVNETNIPVASEQNSINQANQINDLDPAIERDDHQEENFNANDTVN